MSNPNPFAKLQELLASQSPQGDSASASKKGQKPASATGKGRSGGKKVKGDPARQAEHDEDSQLFLQTVNSMPRQDKTVRPPQEDALFKQAMQAAGIIPKDQPARKKRSKGARTAEAAPHNSTHGEQAGGQASNQNTETNQAAALSGWKLEKDKVQHEGLDLPPSTTQTSSQSTGQTAAQNTGEYYNPSPPPEDDMEKNEAALFASAMNAVTPLNKRGRDISAPADTKTPPHPSGKTPAQIMQEIIDGRIEFAIQHTGEYIEGFVQGVSPDVLEKLRMGQFSPEAHVDLHGLNAGQAYAELVRFIKNCYLRNIRTATIITGRGKNSPDGVAVIRNLMQEWLTHDPFKRVVLAFCSAKPCDGGAGALYVLLRKYKKNIGKIQWELPYDGPNADF